MPSATDIRWLLFIAYAVAYPLAVIPPIFIDPVLEHVRFSARSYPCAFMCVPIYLGSLGTQYWVLRTASSAKRLYASVVVFSLAIALTLPIFLPELPHGNVVTVGAVTAFFSAFTVFIWTVGQQQISLTESLSETDAVVSYLNTLSTFVRQGAFAALALFGALFFSAITTMFGYVESISTAPSDRFLLKFNTGVQLSLYGVYSLVGPIRYLFKINLYILERFKKVVTPIQPATSTNPSTS